MGIDDVTRYSDLLGEGLTPQRIRSAVARRELTRPTRSVYGPPGTPMDDLRSVFLRLPPGSVLGWHSAARLLGLPAPHDGRVHVIVPPDADVPLVKGVAAHASILPVDDPIWHHGVPCAPAWRCAVDLARRIPRPDALWLLDSALRAGLSTSEQLAAEVSRHAGLRGIRQARDLVGWADPRAECAQESHLRLVLLDSRLPPPQPQVWVTNFYGTAIYRVDLGYPEERIAIEYDGSSHLDAKRMTNDRYRHNWLVDNGWRVRYFTSRDLYRDPEGIVATVRALLRAS
jgi:hypothetical protein